jgi:ABC-2 type transport system permease protein
MIRTLLRIGWLNLKRDRVAQALTFALPILFFTIFATVFSSQRDVTNRVEVAVVDEDDSAFSRAIVAALKAEGGLDVRTTRQVEGAATRLDRASAEGLVKGGAVPVAVVLPRGVGEVRLAAGADAPRDASRPTVLVMADQADPVAPQVVKGLLQKVFFTAAPDLMAEQGLELFRTYGGALTPTQEEAARRWKDMSQSRAKRGAASESDEAGPGLSIATVNVMRPDQGGALVSFYAAGIGVMFLLFSCAGAGGTLLEEEENGTLVRLVGSRAGMAGVLAGKWLFIALTSAAQLLVMFVWGALVFDLPLIGHLPGFAVMTCVTSGAAAAFGLVLATLSRTRAQLGGISTILILTMSAVGGSMFPRFLMPDAMQQVGLVTFNAWALDGYIKVFWRDAPVTDLWPQVLVLVALTVVFMGAARLFARRWEMA